MTKNYIIDSVNNDLLSLARRHGMLFARDFLTRENHCRIPSLVTKIAINANTYINLYIKHRRWKMSTMSHDDVIKWKHFPRYWPFVRGIHRSSVNSPHTGQWRWALMFYFICAWTNGWVNNREASDFRSHRAHYDVNVIMIDSALSHWFHQ